MSPFHVHFCRNAMLSQSPIQGSAGCFLLYIWTARPHRTSQDRASCSDWSFSDVLAQRTAATADLGSTRWKQASRVCLAVLDAPEPQQSSGAAPSYPRSVDEPHKSAATPQRLAGYQAVTAASLEAVTRLPTWSWPSRWRPPSGRPYTRTRAGPPPGRRLDAPSAVPSATLSCSRAAGDARFAWQCLVFQLQSYRVKFPPFI